MVLATNYPSVFWNCACLIVNAGGTDLLESDDEDFDDETEIKNKSVNYGKISMAIGETKTKGINILPPDINISGLIFEPSYKENAIYYGMKGINKIGTALVYEIFKNRPYTSIEDFLEKVKLNKTQMISLLKTGAFDNLYPDKSREEILNGYFEMISDKKKRITLQNMKMLIEKDLIPKELDFERRLYNFNQYVKNFKVKTFYKLDKKALKFYLDNYDDSLLV